MSIFVAQLKSQLKSIWKSTEAASRRRKSQRKSTEPVSRCRLSWLKSTDSLTYSKSRCMHWVYFTSVDFVHVTGIGKTHGTASFFIRILCTQCCKNYSHRMTSVCASVRNTSPYGVDRAFATAPRDEQATESSRLCQCAYVWSPASVDFSSNRHLTTRSINIAECEFWRFSLRFLKSMTISVLSERAVIVQKLKSTRFQNHYDFSLTDRYREAGFIE